MATLFSQNQLQAIADALGHATEGLTGDDIGKLLASATLFDRTPEVARRYRLYNAFAHSQTTRSDRKAVLAFIRKAMRSETFARHPDRYEPMRANLNHAIAFAGLEFEANGDLVTIDEAPTSAKATERASELRALLKARGAHEDVVYVCRDDLVDKNYAAALIEAARTLADKLRERSGLEEDGMILADRALAGEPPLIPINAFASAPERVEQRGFANVVKGAFGMFAVSETEKGVATLSWAANREDAADALMLLSMIHRRLDAAAKK